ncbi:MAG TPA: MauE/DoxX family redox-associated membrane protein [Conexibacter sp.]
MLATIADVVLGLVLLGSATAKLAAPSRTRAALATFGLTTPRTRTLAWAGAVAAELLLGIGVALGLTAAAYAAAALMLGFAALLARALRSGRAGQPCGCLGARSRVTRAALARTLLLAAAFALLPSAPDVDPSAEAWLAAGLGVSLAATAALAVLLLALAREVGELRLAIPPQLPLELDGEGPPRGSRAAAAIERFVPAPSNRLALAVFASEGCPMCHALEPAVAALRQDPLLAVETFDEREDADVWRAHEIPGSPYALVLSLDGTVLAQGTFNSARQLEALVAAGDAREPQLVSPARERERAHA